MRGGHYRPPERWSGGHKPDHGQSGLLPKEHTFGLRRKARFPHEAGGEKPELLTEKA